MNGEDEKKLKSLLQEHLPPVSGKLERDLWPRMKARLYERGHAVPWWDWALAGAAVTLLLVAPQSILLLMYQF